MKKNTKKILLTTIAIVTAIFIYKRILRNKILHSAYPFADKIKVNKGESFEIDFGRYSASSGQWWILSNSEKLSILEDNGQQAYPTDEDMEKESRGLLGGGYNMKWKFTAKKKGTEVLKFVFPRAEYVTKTREVVVTVE